MTNLHKTLNPISREERVKINENWDRIMARFNNLQLQINFLSGEEVDVIVEQIETAILNAENVTADAQETLIIVNDALEQLTTIITNAISATDKANTATNNANLLIDEMNALKGQLEALQIDLSDIVQSENQRILNETNRVDAENSRATVFDNQMQITDSKLAIIDSLIDDLESFAYSPTTTYRFPNFVTYEGSTYIALKEVTGITPTDDGRNYRLIASKGDKGETGAALSILGKLTDASQLPPTGTAGDAYTINGELYVWSDNTNDWENVGNIKGEKGDKGDKGEQGQAGNDADVTKENIENALGYIPANQTALGSLGQTVVRIDNNLTSLEQQVTTHLDENSHIKISDNEPTDMAVGNLWFDLGESNESGGGEGAFVFGNGILSDGEPGDTNAIWLDYDE